jgi:signal transduction histidine kinase
MKRFVLLIALIVAVRGALPQPPVDSLLQRCANAAEQQKAELYLKVSAQFKDDSTKARRYIQMAYQKAVQNHQPWLQARALCDLGDTFAAGSEYERAIPVYRKALALYTRLNDPANRVNCHKLIGLCYYNLDQGDKAIDEFFEGLKLCEKDTLTSAKLLSNIAMTNVRMTNRTDAIRYYREALALNSAIGNYEGMAVNYNGLGEIYKLIQRPDSALVDYAKARKLSKKRDFRAIVLYNMAGIYINDPDSLVKAVACLNQSWAEFRKLGMNQYEAEYQQSMGFIFFKSGQYQSAIQALTRSIELNDQFNRGLKIKATCENILAKIYEKTGDYRAALEHTKRHIQYANSMALKEKYDQIANLEKRYESEKKEREIERLAAQQQITLIRLRKNKQLKELGIAGVALLLLLAFLIWLKYLDKKKTNIVLEEKNKVIVQSEHELRVLNASKNKFFSIIAHDLKNPLHTVLGYADLLNKEYDRFGDEDRRKFAHHIYQSTNNIFRLLQNLLEWSRTQTGRMNFSPAIVEYQRLLDNSLNVLKALADQKNIVIKTGNDPELKIFADPFMIETVLRNLINNAIKFTPEGGQIEVSAKKADGQVVVSVSDTGIGISEEETQNLFRIDSKVKRKGTNNEEGTGLGLILCHEFVSRHHGKIWVESTPGKGSEFIFSIPAKATA